MLATVTMATAGGCQTESGKECVFPCEYQNAAGKNITIDKCTSMDEAKLWCCTNTTGQHTTPIRSRALTAADCCCAALRVCRHAPFGFRAIATAWSVCRLAWLVHVA